MATRLAKDLYVYTFGSLLTKSIGFFLIPLFTRFLSVEEYGILTLLTYISQLASFIFLMGISSSAMRFYFNSDADAQGRKIIYGNALILTLIFPFALLMIFVPLTRLIIENYMPTIPFYPFVIITLIIAVLDPMHKLLLGLLRAQKESRKFVAFNFSFFIIQSLIIICAVSWLKFGLRGVLYGQLITNIIFWIIAIKILRNYSKLLFSPKISKDLIIFGLPLIPYFIFVWANNSSGRFLLERYGDLRDVGIFALASQFSNMLFFLSQAMDNAFLPFFYEAANEKNGSDRLGRFINRYLILFGTLGMFTVLLAPPLLRIMADVKFHDAISYVPLLVLAGWLDINYKIFHYSLMYSKKTSLVSGLAACKAFLTVFFLIIFLKYAKMGTFGVVQVMVVVNLAMLFLGYNTAQRYFFIRFNLIRAGLIFFLYMLSLISIGYIEISKGWPFDIIAKTFYILLLILVAMKIGNVKNIKRLILDWTYGIIR